MFFLHLHILPQNPQNPQKFLAEKKKSVSICEIRGRLFSARSFCEFCEFCGRINAGARLLGWCSWDSCTPWEGGVGMAGMPYPPTKTPTDCTDVHRLGSNNAT